MVWAAIQGTRGGAYGPGRHGVHGRAPQLRRATEPRGREDSVAERVKGLAHTNRVESFWSMLTRAHKSTFHKLSARHLQRYLDEFAGRQEHPRR